MQFRIRQTIAVKHVLNWQEPTAEHLTKCVVTSSQVAFIKTVTNAQIVVIAQYKIQYNNVEYKVNIMSSICESIYKPQQTWQIHELRQSYKWLGLRTASTVEPISWHFLTFCAIYKCSDLLTYLHTYFSLVQLSYVQYLNLSVPAIESRSPRGPLGSPSPGDSRCIWGPQIQLCGPCLIFKRK